MATRDGSSVQAHSAELKKELGLRDLVFTQILFVAGFTNLGTAAKLGPSHVVFWLLATVFFYIPDRRKDPLSVRIEAPENWRLSCGLDSVEGDPRTLLAPSYDVRAD